MIENHYTFGSAIARKLDYFAFPRTGSHYLWLCFSGLLDLVFYENKYTKLPEAVQRFDELDPLAVYALKLREDGAPYQPVFINASANGLHGKPINSGNPIITLIRDPWASIYSLYKTSTERWNATIDDPVAWLNEKLQEFAAFYDAAFDLSNDAECSCLLIRYEELCTQDEILSEIVSFIGVQPKLSCEYVRHWTQFERMTQQQERTFFRSGNNEAWKQDAAWKAIVEKADAPSFARFGYE